MLPQDPVILLSYINTQLRDYYDSFASLCSDLELDGAALEAALGAIGYAYSPEHNQFQ